MSPSRAILGVVVSSFLGACAGPRTAPGSSVNAKASEDAAIAAAVSSLAAKQNDYKISPADLLTITVYQTPDLSREMRVSQEGEISFPLAGTIAVGGKSVIQAEAALAAKLANFLVSPQVSLFIKEYGNKQVYVLGDVKTPGSYLIPIGSNLTVLGAISMAGGFTQVAAPDRTRVIRNLNGKNETFTVQISEITKQGHKEKDISLLPSDIVYVPQSYF